MGRFSPFANALVAGTSSLQGDRQRKKAEHVAAEERAAKRSLEEAIGLRAQAKHDADMRGAGYIPEAEAAGPDGNYKVEGQQLEAMLGAASSTGAMPLGMKLDDIVTPKRYGQSVGGYKYDNQSDAARLRRAQVERAEGTPTKSVTPQRGTPEYLKMLADEENARNAANPPQAKPVDVPNLSLQMNERFRQHPSVKAADEMQGQVAMLNELRDGTPMGAGDIAIIIGFNKVLDPGAIVREGDVALAQSAASLKGRLESFVANAKEGEKMDPQLRADMLAVSNRLARIRMAKARSVAQEFRAMAQKHGGDPDLTTMGYQHLLQPEDPKAFLQRTRGQR